MKEIRELLKGEKCLRDTEYIECVKDLLKDPKCQQMIECIQHGNTTTFKHCLDVSYFTYRVCKAYGLDYRSAARGALLHDFFLYDWHGYERKTGNYFHGFTHPRVALHNANHYFDLNEIEQDIIVKHMWPLTVVPPKYKEGYVVMYADKHCGFVETTRRIKHAGGHFCRNVLKIT